MSAKHMWAVVALVVGALGGGGGGLALARPESDTSTIDARLSRVEARLVEIASRLAIMERTERTIDDHEQRLRRLEAK